MATESVAPRREAPPEEVSCLASHNFTMDHATATLLFKIQGIAQLMRNATAELRVDEPTPDGVQTSIWAIEDLATDALKRAGLA
jgi:hypothetical protein